MKKKFTPLLFAALSSSIIFISSNQASACHPLPLVNVLQTIGATGVTINASSNGGTCGCATQYWLDAELQYNPLPFLATPANPQGCFSPAPGNWVSLTGPMCFTSAWISKPNCVLTPHQPVFVPFSSLCPGTVYKWRFRERLNLWTHSSLYGDWSATFTFTTPGIAPQPPTITATASPNPICPPQTAQITSTVSAACGASTYTWSPSTGLSCTTCPNPVASPTVTTVYTVTYTNAYGTTSTPITITIGAIPLAGTASVTPNPICTDSTVNLTLTGSSGSIQWQSGPTSTGPWTNISGATTATFTTGALIANTCFQAVVTSCVPPIVTSNVVCVTVSPPAMLSPSSTSVSCIGGNNGSATVTVSGGGPIYTYLWNNGQSTQTATGLTAGNYIVTVTTNGCPSSATVTVGPGNASPVSNFTLNNVCVGQPTVFMDGSTVASGNISLWNWNFGDGNTSITQSPQHTYNIAGTFSVTLIVTTSFGCTDTFVQNITVYALPIVNFVSSSVCVGNTTSFLDSSFSSTGNIVSWNWNFADPASGASDTSLLQNPTHIFTSSGNYNVTLTVTSNQGCVSSLVLQTIVFPLPKAEFESDPGPTASLIDDVLFNDLSTGNVVQWFWDFGDGTTDTIQFPSHVYSDTGTYVVTLIVISNNGCVDTIEHLLSIKYFSFYIPNAFTPNGDGKNDFFFGKGFGITEYEMWIFDHWGNIIFQCKVNDLPQTFPCMWDGIARGGSSDEIVPQDVYVWKVHFLNVFKKEFTYIGTVSVAK